MKALFTLAMLLISVFVLAQTTHQVAVRIGQGSDCPAPLSVNNTEEFLLFPNPTQDHISIQGEFENALINLYSIEGRLIQSNVPFSRQGVLNLQGLEQGIYILNMQVDSKMISRKIRIQ